MPATNLTNLLSPERQRALRRDYFVRYGVAVVVAITILIVIAGILLFPTYVFLTKALSAKEARLASIESKLSSADEVTLSARLSNLAHSTTILMRLSKIPSTSVLIRNLLAVSHPGITLSGFSYTPSADKNANILTISGTATTRDALRAYQVALQDTSFIQTADLPISVYAKDTDISFTVTITLVP